MTILNVEEYTKGFPREAVAEAIALLLEELPAFTDLEIRISRDRFTDVRVSYADNRHGRSVVDFVGTPKGDLLPTYLGWSG